VVHVLLKICASLRVRLEPNIYLKKVNDSMISIWSANYSTATSTVVIPDGCRDLIVKTLANEKPNWLVSPLYDQSEFVQIEASCNYIGFRLSPGAEIKELELLDYIEKKQLHVEDVKDIIGDFTSIESSIEEALTCLANEKGSVKQISAQLGVSTRTLQRLLLSKTKRTPGYWLQLARIRKAARSLSQIVCLADVAENYGFSDQSHMNREFQRWFGLTPVQVLNSPAIIRQLNDKGYA